MRTNQITILFSIAMLAVATPTRAQTPEKVEAILDRVEVKGQSINDLRCKVVYTVEDRIAADTVVRKGEILFRRNEPNPKFFITFSQTVQDGILSKTSFWYLFDGRWFWEANERAKSIIKRDIAPPGTEIDMFSIDKAPFPIPFGQRKDNILKHFNVQFGDGGDNPPPNTDHLICTPKPTSRMAAEYRQMEFFVSRAVDLPVRTVMVSRDGTKITTANFPDLTAKAINQGLKDSAFKLPTETRRYAIVEEK